MKLEILRNNIITYRYRVGAILTAGTRPRAFCFEFKVWTRGRRR